MIGGASRFERVPVIPEPPHDPTSLLVDDRTGWRAAAPGGFDGVDVSPCDGALSLALRPAAQRRFTETSGSFGGLVPPANVSLTSDGSVFLLDRRALTLKRFDPCTCRFVDVPCLGGHHRPPGGGHGATTEPAASWSHGGGARQLRNPGGVAICGDVLYVCDRGLDGKLATGSSPRRNALRTRIRGENHRVSVFLLPGFQLRGHLQPPGGRWKPVAVACDSRGCVWVADAWNGVIHRFTGRRSSAVVKGLDRPEHLALDRADRLWVIERVPTGERRLRVFDTGGSELPAPARVEDALARFAPVPFAVSPEGTLSLGALCTSQCPGASTTFDLHGLPADAPPITVAPFLTNGTYRTAALDSQTQGCQWHRVVVHGELPASTRLGVRTFCADEEYDADQLAGFATWARLEITSPTRGPGGGRPLLDCLVPSPPGRFLWLELTLTGNGTATPVVRAIEIEFPRLTSLRYLPAVFASEPTSADFTARFVSLFDTTVRGIERVVDTEASLFDPASTPAERVGTAPIDFLSWLATWIGVTFDRSWSEPRRRRLLARAGAFFAWRGTVRGLREQLLTLLGWDPPASCGATALHRTVCGERPLNCAPPPEVPAYEPPPLILEHFRLRRWLHLGVGRLGAQAMLWGQRIVNRTQLDASTQAGRAQLIMTPDPHRDPLHVYAHRFTVFVPACMGRSEAGRKSLDNLLRAESPAHTKWDVAWVEPRFRIGVQSMLGFDAVVAGLPPAMRLDGAPLGTGTLIGTTARPAGRRELRVGRSGRVGTGSQLN